MKNDTIYATGMFIALAIMYILAIGPVMLVRLALGMPAISESAALWVAFSVLLVGISSVYNVVKRNEK